jgi:hypothetical protein
VKTENGRGRGGGGWSLVKDMIELAKAEVITVPPDQRERVLERARQEMEIWRGGPQVSKAAAQQRAAHRSVRSGSARPGQPAPAARRAGVSRKLAPA